MPSAKTIRVTGLDKVLKGLNKLSDQKKKDIEQIFDEGARMIERKAIRAAPVGIAGGGGGIKGAISKNKVKDGHEIVVQKDYAVYVETGTKGKFTVDPEFASYVAQFRGGQSNGDFFASILAWVKAKRIRFEDRNQKRSVRTTRKKYLTDEETAWRIVKSISREGIDAQPFLLTSFKEVRDSFIIPEIMKIIT